VKKKANPEESRPIVSYATGLPKNFTAYCEAYAALFSQVQHDLHAARQKPNFDTNKTKRDYQIRYGINARQYNGVKIDLDGKESSTAATHKLNIAGVKESIVALKSKVKTLKAEIVKSNKEKDKFVLHQKQRRLYRQTAKLTRITKEGAKLCFGSRKLFNQQNNLAANGFTDHADWLSTWQKERSSTFMLVGSRGEPSGNYSAQLVEQANDAFSLTLRVPPALVNQFGPVIKIDNLRFNYYRGGKNNALTDLKAALANNEAITYRFNRGKRDKWTAHVTCRRFETELISARWNGRVGIDINNGSLDAAFVDFEGNLKEHLSVPFKTSKSANHDQIKASIGEAVKSIVAFAVKHKTPIVIEDLDFSGKKKAMKDKGLRSRAMLSAFSYAAVTATIKSRAYREGIEVYQVKPQFSSLIGCVKYQSQYGINSGVAAAIVLGRRHQRFSERCPLAVAFTPKSPADGLRHVWSRWAALARNIHALAKRKIFVKRHDWFRKSGALSTAEVKLMDTDGLSVKNLNCPGFMGKDGKSTFVLDESSSANRQKHSSSGVVVNCND
jgi:IS605 OrfB family transposase